MELSLGVKVHSCWLDLEGNRAMSLAVRVPKPLNRNYLLGNTETLCFNYAGNVSSDSMMIFFFSLCVSSGKDEEDMTA